MTDFVSPENNTQIVETEQFYDNGIPKGCEPIREEEFERLPDYVIELISQSDRGELLPTTREQLVELSESFFAVQNSTNLQNEEIENAIVILNEENEQGGNRNFGASGEVSSPQQ